MTAMESEENDIFQVTIILSRALGNLFSLTWFRTVIRLIITSARMCQRGGTNRALPGNCNDITVSATAVNSVKKEVCDPVEVAFARLAYLFSCCPTPQKKPKTNSKPNTQPPQINS